MELTKEMLQALGIAEAQAEAILSAHAADMNEAASQHKAEMDEAASQHKLAMDAAESRCKAVSDALDAERDADWRGRCREAERMAHRAFKQSECLRLLRAEGVPERYVRKLARMTDLDRLDMDGEQVRDEAAARAWLRSEWGDFIPRDVVMPLCVDTPPAVAENPRVSVEAIMAIEDDARREREIARNHELFGF